jgi:hypothetical protein
MADIFSQSTSPSPRRIIPTSSNIDIPGTSQRRLEDPPPASAPPTVFLRLPSENDSLLDRTLTSDIQIEGQGDTSSDENLRVEVCVGSGALKKLSETFGFQKDSKDEASEVLLLEKVTKSDNSLA